MFKLIISLAFVANLNSLLTAQVAVSKPVLIADPVDEFSDGNIIIRCVPGLIVEFCPICPPLTCETKDLVLECSVPLELSAKSKIIKPIGGGNCPRPICKCPDGLYMTSDYKCVKKEECPQPCFGLNEMPFDCANSPCIRNCKTRFLNTACKPNPDDCKPGCVCIDGYLRDVNNICVPKDKCPGRKFVFDPPIIIDDPVPSPVVM